jgi:hypothetical protein
MWKGEQLLSRKESQSLKSWLSRLGVLVRKTWIKVVAVGDEEENWEKLRQQGGHWS